ncbi:hypothetical protein DID88_008085 [Monilinia fructigena]|uniref:Uncharacterized protein n=1 Tax=Monilinia fructigena TaxID=38457 RepID=A0A395J485_9HELO|nr:hypothetical protein DID88_008085 [Monilinia fructigena]
MSSNSLLSFIIKSFVLSHYSRAPAMPIQHPLNYLSRLLITSTKIYQFTKLSGITSNYKSGGLMRINQEH